MQKAKDYDYASSNLANFGTEIETKVKEASAAAEVQWKGVGQKPGLEIWRVVKFKLQRVQTPGRFFENDSYIVLSTYKKNDALRHDIFFWLGRTTTQDEMGTAAYKSVELDTFLKGEPVQHREIADHESAAFLKLFEEKGGIRIMEGGADSGFNHVKPEEYRPRLLWLKGRRRVRVKEMPKTHESLNSGDVFILDAGLKLYQWNGSAAGPREKMRAAQLVRSLDDERRGLPEVIVVEEGDDEGDAAAFWEALGGKGDVKGADEVQEDEEWEVAQGDNKLFKLSDASGSLEFTEVPCKRDSLDSNDVFVLDIGAELLVWQGKGASVTEKRQAMASAQEYAKSHDRPAFLPITLFLEGGENDYFRTHMP